MTLTQELQHYETMFYSAPTQEIRDKRFASMVEATECLDEHPEDYEGPCFCHKCKHDWADA